MPRPLELVVDDGPEVIGAVADDVPDPREVWERAKKRWGQVKAKRERRESQTVRFRHGPACIVFLADLHLGAPGVDYPRVRSDCEIVADMPNTVAALVGDLTDNFIGRWAHSIRFDTPFTIEEEHLLAAVVLEILAPKLAINVGGNHDEWTRRAAGVDVMKRAVARARKGVLYDRDDALVTIEVGKARVPMRLRHKWRGSSIYNPTHGQERAARWDQNAVVYVGAHTHTGTVARSFDVGGEKRLAIQLGSYKREDNYARREGFTIPGPDAAAALIITEDGKLLPVEHLELAHNLMWRLTA